MAYGNKYYGGWSSKAYAGHIYIDLDGFSGAPEQITLKPSTKINYMFGDWNSPIIGLNAEFEVVNDRADFFELMPLLTAEERQYRVRIMVESPSASACTLFEGYINCDTQTQKYLKRQDIKFVASGYLSKLDYDHPASIDTLQYISFIDIIDEILRGTGFGFNIRVNSTLYADGDTKGLGQTLFNLNGFYSELYWEDNVTRTSGLEILKSILKSFDCYIYWFDGYWYIERYEDIWSSAVDYIEYTSGVSYGKDDVGEIVPISKTTKDLHTLLFSGQTQTLSLIPGVRKITVALNTKEAGNLTIPDLTNAVSSVNYDPTLRGWTYVPYVSGTYPWAYSNLGKVHNNITNSIHRTSERTLTHVNQHEKGLTTKFWMTIEADDTVLSVSYMYATLAPWLQGLPSWAASKEWADFTFLFPWWMKIDVGGVAKYVTWNSEDGEYELTEPASVHDALQFREEINGSAFDASYGSYEVKVAVTLGALLVPGDYLVTFGIGTEQLYKSDATTSEMDHNSVSAWFGDVIVAASAQPQNNVIEGVVTTANFLNVRELDIDLYDSSSWNCKNSILRDVSESNPYGTRTVQWTTDGVHFHTTANRLLMNKFQLFNSTRQLLTGNVERLGLVKPMQMFTDSHQSGKQFLLMAYTYNLEGDNGVVQLYEYDNVTDVNLT